MKVLLGVSGDPRTFRRPIVYESFEAFFPRNGSTFQAPKGPHSVVTWEQPLPTSIVGYEHISLMSSQGVKTLSEFCAVVIEQSTMYSVFQVAYQILRQLRYRMMMNHVVAIELQNLSGDDGDRFKMARSRKAK